MELNPDASPFATPAHVPAAADVTTSPFAQPAHIERTVPDTAEEASGNHTAAAPGRLRSRRRALTAACVAMSFIAGTGLFSAVTATGPFSTDNTQSSTQQTAPTPPTTPVAEPVTNDTPSPTNTTNTASATTEPEEPAGTSAPAATTAAATIATVPTTTASSATTTTVPVVPGTDVGQPTRPTPTSAVSGVYVVGDSLTVGVVGKIEPLLTSLNVPVTVDGVASRRTAAGITTVAALELTDDNVIVVALGTNDESNAASFTTLIDDMMTASRGAHVIWLTMDRAGYETLNTALYAAERRYPNLTIADWAAYSNAHPEWDGGDQIHYNGNGYTARAQFIADMVFTVAG